MKARNQRRTYYVRIPLHTLEILATYKKTINASDTTADTVRLIATDSVLCVPSATHVDENMPFPPITAAPWSMREVALGAVSCFACFVPLAVLNPVNCTAVLVHAPDLLKKLAWTTRSRIGMFADEYRAYVAIGADEPLSSAATFAPSVPRKLETK
ncbi:hypothetical protein C8Q76DRAFT_798147 [Earliella scabrosa]|nr:hypothetical protein C8Q76DRAFT_798147 [Earliella scabrosa]